MKSNTGEVTETVLSFDIGHAWPCNIKRPMLRYSAMFSFGTMLPPVAQTMCVLFSNLLVRPSYRSAYKVLSSTVFIPLNSGSIVLPTNRDGLGTARPSASVAYIGLVYNTFNRNFNLNLRNKLHFLIVTLPVPTLLLPSIWMERH